MAMVGGSVNENETAYGFEWMKWKWGMICLSRV